MEEDAEDMDIMAAVVVDMAGVVDIAEDVDMAGVVDIADTAEVVDGAAVVEVDANQYKLMTDPIKKQLDYKIKSLTEGI